MKGFFVTGTGTGVGKTVCSAILMNELRRSMPVCYWKPVQTGIEEDNDTLTVKTLAACADEEIFEAGFRLEKPLSPHLAARLADVELTIEKILQFIENTDDKRFWIIEGAGGLLVPLNESELMSDLIKALNLPVIVVAQSGLGTINHTLLTLEALRNRRIRSAGVMLNGEPNAENKKAIEHFGKIRIIAEVPKMERLNIKNVIFNWEKSQLPK